MRSRGRVRIRHRGRADRTLVRTEFGQVISLSTQGKSAKLNGPVIKVTIAPKGVTVPDTPTDPGTPPSTNKNVFVDSGPMAGSANGIFFDGDNNLLVANVFGQTITKLDPETGEVLDRLDSTDLVAFPDDVTVGPDGTIYWTEIAFGGVVRKAPGQPSEFIVAPGTVASVNPITLSDDGRLFVAGCYNATPEGNAIVEVDLVNGGILKTIRDGDPGCASNAMDFSDGILYSPRPFEGRVVKVDVDTGDLTDLTTGWGVPIAVKFNSAGVLHAADQASGEVVRIDTANTDTSANREVLATLPEGWIDNIAFDKDDRLFVSSASDGAVVEILADGTIRTVLAGQFELPLGVAVIGDTLYTGNPGVLSGYDIETAERTSALRSAFGVGNLPAVTSMIPWDDRLVMMTGLFGELVIWDPATSTVLAKTALAVPTDAQPFGDDLIVTESGTGNVLRFTDGDFMQSTVLATLDYPLGLAGNDDDLYVGDGASGEVLQLIADGVVLDPPKVVASGLMGPEGLELTGNTLLVIEGGTESLIELDLASGVTSVLQTDLGFQAPIPGVLPSGFFNDVAVADGSIFINSDRLNRIWRFAAPNQPAGQNTIQALEADGRFTTLLAAFDASFLTPPPEGQLFTLLAPTDEAFAALPPGLLDDLLANPGFLTDVLAYHLIEGAVPAETVVTLTEARSALGAPIGIEVVDGTVVLNGSVNVIETDILTTEGIIHVLDGVLELPPPPDQVGFLRADYARGSTEVPDSGDPDALSNAFVDVLDTGDEATLEVCVFIETTIEDPTLAHIHRGAAGEAGSVEVDFDFSADSWGPDEFNPSQRFFAQGCVDVDDDLAFELLDRPGEFYVNIHSVGFPAGANREQLVDGDIDDPRAFTAAPLLGSNEVPGPGDADSGRNWVDLYLPTTDTGELCYTSQVFRVDEITSGHIHTGPAGESGDVLVDLQYGTRWKLLTHPSGQGFFVWGCVTITADALGAIEANPAGHYVNLHNETFPDGAVRAQLVAGVGETIRLAELASADGQSNDLFGFADMALFPTQGLLCWDTPNTGIGQPTAMSISDASGVVVEFDLATYPMLAVVLDPFIEFTSFGCQTVADETLQGLVDTPSDYTMSMDSADSPGALTGVVFDPFAGPPPPEPPPDGDRPDIIPLPNGFQPEGVAVGQGTDLFVGSLGRLGDDGTTVTGGAIYKADAATGQGAVLVEARGGQDCSGPDGRRSHQLCLGGRRTLRHGQRV